MTVPGVGVITAAALLAQVGEISRFRDPRHLAGYLGLDPRVRQSGATAARTGRISKEGSGARAAGPRRGCAHTIRSPGPLRAFFERVRGRPRSLGRDRRRRPQDVQPVLAPPHQRTGLRIRDADRHREEAPQGRAHRRRAGSPRRRTRRRHQP
jgi:transposase